MAYLEDFDCPKCGKHIHMQSRSNRGLCGECEKDERLSYPAADVFSNAPLALIQTDLEAKVRTLEWVLKK